MPIKISSQIAAFFLLNAVSTVAFADYPIASNRYLADPTALVTKDRVYIYCSNDDENPTGNDKEQGSFNIPNVVCVSSSDMKNWTDHGIVFDAARDTKWAKKTWAPAAIERDGRYFLYFGNGGGNIGVVSSDSPTGPFTDPRGRYLIDGGTPGVLPAEHMWIFDPMAFIDKDGQAYLYFGGNGDKNIRYIKLNRDMISTDGPATTLTAPNFFEASWMHERNGIYYFSYSTTPKAGMRIDYMTSTSPTGGFTYGGVVADQPPINHNNNHAAIFEFKGQWYHAYHNRIVANKAGIPTAFRRNLAIESLNYRPDGFIQKVQYTIDGVKQIGHLTPYERVEGETFNAQSGIETEPNSNGGMNLTAIDNGDWIKLKGVDFGARGAKRFKAQVAAGMVGGNIEIRLDAPDGKLIGTCIVQKTVGTQQWKTAMTKVSKTTGVHDLYLKFTGKSGELFKLNYWQFQ